MYLYKAGKKIVCFIQSCKEGYEVCNGKPSDVCCLSFAVGTLEHCREEAMKFAKSITFREDIKEVENASN
jgi:hypothetical protein